MCDIDFNKYLKKSFDINAYNCWTLVKDIYRERGYELFDINVKNLDVGWSFRGNKYFDEHSAREWIEVKAPEKYDVILFQNKRGIAHHIGVMISTFKFIHCSKSGVNIQRITTIKWLIQFKGYYRLMRATKCA